ncbi:beta-galactosidase 13 [Hibiscus trionum]|uniref:Beta-galactosidase n=1 Tax=Hibiscus trionum TaxID=183268 RepID=A0A9W7J693_HIBTR|nr:beta-galactosidase 13 [Hibiscus trionum]
MVKPLSTFFLSTLLLVAYCVADEAENEDDNTKVDSHAASKSVTYDARSVIINGKRELLFSGAIHYPRSTPDMWPHLIQKSKRGGINTIETYVFWNAHEPVQGQFNFEGQYDLVKFIKLIHQHNMYAVLRLGPFVQAEWNNGGLPYWLREVPNIIFRSDNEPYKEHMQRFVTMIVKKMKEEKLFAPQGGPIVLAQIENEYNTIQLAYREKGDSYVQWAAKMALSLDVQIPWIMCKQKDAPDPVINTCNGRHCGDTFSGPNKPNKPSLWTENWTTQFRVFGDPPSQRSAEDLSYSVARFFSKNGSMVNYYMYHGGTNFGRTSSSFTSTRYYDEAPLDEYGLLREPKWGHLRDVHKSLILGKRALLWGTPTVEKLSPELEAIVWQQPGTPVCTAFLANNNTQQPQVMNFKGQQYLLPPRSISILPDCKTVVFNTNQITAQHNSRKFVRSEIANKNFNWEMYREVPPTETAMKSPGPLEHWILSKDTTDYVWFMAQLKLEARDLPMKKDVVPTLRVASEGHGVYAFINGEYIGTEHGSKVEKNFVFQKPAPFKEGNNYIALFSFVVGLPDSGAYMERRYAGPRSITILGLNTGTLDITDNGWSHQVGIVGENKKVFTEEGSKSVKWSKAEQGGPITWYKGSFDAPEGNNPVLITMDGMGKGMVWINGNNIGRYWVSYLSPLKTSTQPEYHIPRSFLKPKDNLIVIFEEEKGIPKAVYISTANRDTICSVMGEHYPPSPRWFENKAGIVRPLVNDLKPKVELTCPDQKKIAAVEFASFGDPFGSCGSYVQGNCTAPASKQVVEKLCLGKPTCKIPVEAAEFGNMIGACAPNAPKTLAVQVVCENYRKRVHKLKDSELSLQELDVFESRLKHFGRVHLRPTGDKLSELLSLPSYLPPPLPRRDALRLHVFFVVVLLTVNLICALNLMMIVLEQHQT